jgi:TPR repeat protein
VRRRSRLIALLFVATLGVSAAGAQGDDVRAALERGDATAQATLGAIYLRGQGVPVDYAAAARLFRGAAEEGHAAAQNALGLLYAGGLGVAQDYAQAVSWYRRAAEQGAPEHQFDLAVMYDNGLGVERNPALAAEWYGKAAAQGFAEAEASLGFLYQQGAGVPQDLAKAFALYGRAARKGNARAQNNLGLMYTRGEGVAQNYPLAVDWYRKAANQGFAKAITNLGVMYENGFGVAQDEAEARRLYRLGGRQDADATDAVLDQVGFFADPRLARPPDAAARDSVKAAAERGEPDAQFLLAWLLSAGPTAERDLPAAARLYAAAAEKGHTAAMANLGVLYLKGWGVPQDYMLGYMWINLAASGLGEAGKLRDALAKQMTAAQINEAQALSRQRSEGRR